MKYGRHNKRAYQTLRTLTNTSRRSTSIIKVKWKAIDEIKILNIWIEY